MKKLMTLVVALLAISSCLACNSDNNTIKYNDKMEKILFVNGSPNRDGNTAALAKVLLEGRPYETLNLNDYRLNFYGQKLEGDQFDEVLSQMKKADIVVMGSPVYWHNLVPRYAH